MVDQHTGGTAEAPVMTKVIEPGCKNTVDRLNDFLIDPGEYQQMPGLHRCLVLAGISKEHGFR